MMLTTGAKFKGVASSLSPSSLSLRRRCRTRTPVSCSGSAGEESDSARTSFDAQADPLASVAAITLLGGFVLFQRRVSLAVQAREARIEALGKARRLRSQQITDGDNAAGVAAAVAEEQAAAALADEERARTIVNMFDGKVRFQFRTPLALGEPIPSSNTTAQDDPTRDDTGDEDEDNDDKGSSKNEETEMLLSNIQQSVTSALTAFAVAIALVTLLGLAIGIAVVDPTPTL